MVSFTLKLILHGEENDSKYRDVAPLNPSHKRGFRTTEDFEFSDLGDPRTIYVWLDLQKHVR